MHDILHYSCTTPASIPVSNPTRSMHSSTIGRWQCSGFKGKTLIGNCKHDLCIEYEAYSHWLTCMTVVGHLDPPTKVSIRICRLYIPYHPCKICCPSRRPGIRIVHFIIPPSLSLITLLYSCSSLHLPFCLRSVDAWCFACESAPTHVMLPRGRH